MNKIAGRILIFLSMGVTALAGFPSPEIDPASGLGALVAIVGAVLIIRGRRRA